MGPSTRYLILERLAVGGMGEVFLARQEGIGGFARAVVLKKLLPDIAAEEDATRRFLDEARVASALMHPNVVSIIDVGEREDGPFIALEYVHGENVAVLRQRARKAKEPIPVVVAARIVADAAAGLQHVHDARDADGRPLHIVHRDISPKNVFVRVDGTSKIGDFGIARSEHRLSKTATGAVPGTLSYMSPEQAAAEPMGPESDQFSLGIVLWELLAGERLFKADSAIETIRMLLGKKIRRPSDHRPEARILDDIALRMLSRDPADRYPSLAHVVDEIFGRMPECEGETGLMAVADLVEELAGDPLRERQKRLEAPKEMTADELTKVDPHPLAPRAQSSDAPTTAERKRGLSTPQNTPGTPHVDEAFVTVRDRPRRRAPLIAAALLVGVAVAGAAGAATLLRPPSDEERTRAYLKDALVRNPFLHRDVFLAMATLDEIDEDVARKTADTLIPLMEKRLALLAAHWALPAADRDARGPVLESDEQALEDKARAALGALDNEDLAVEALDMWAYDSSAPAKWLEADDALTIQAELRTTTLEFMQGQAEIRALAVPAMLKRACGEPARTNDALMPIVKEREALVERLATAPLADLENLDHAMDDAELRAKALLEAACGPALGPAIASVALHFISDPEEVEPLYGMLPSTRAEKKESVRSR